MASVGSIQGCNDAWDLFSEGYLLEHAACMDCQANNLSVRSRKAHYTRSDPRSRYDLQNVVALCRHCHELRIEKYET